MAHFQADVGCQEFEVENARFTREVNVEYAAAFDLKEVMLESGPFKGKHALIVIPRDSFPFFKLPIELRKEILTMALKEDDAIPIIPSYNSKAPSVKLPKRRMTASQRSTPIYCRRAEPSTFSLLRVSKQFNEEAAPIAYSINLFKFNTPPGLRLFLEKTHNMSRFIRQIKLESIQHISDTNTVLFSYLKELPDLRTIYIGHDTVCKYLGKDRKYRTTQAQEMLGAGKAMLSSLHALQVHEGRPGQILDLFKVVRDDRPCIDCDSWYHRGSNFFFANTCQRHSSCNVKSIHMDSHHQDLTKIIRGHIADFLGIKEGVFHGRSATTISVTFMFCFGTSQLNGKQDKTPYCVHVVATD